MDRYRLLQTFVAVVDAGGISRASRQLNVSKSAVSERVAALEHLVGERLLARTTRSVTLTERGRAVYEEYAPLVAKFGELSLRHNSHRAIEGRLRIAAMLDVGLHEIGAVIGALRADHPGLRAELILGNEAVDPRVGGFDLSFHFRKSRVQTVEQVAVARLECGVYAAPSYLARRGTPAGPGDLIGHDCLGYSFQPGVEDWNASVWLFGRERERLRVQVPLVLRANSATVLRDLALAGLGIVVLPHARAREVSRSGALVPLLDEWRLPALTLFAAFAPGARTTARARLVVDSVRARFATD